MKDGKDMLAELASAEEEHARKLTLARHLAIEAATGNPGFCPSGLREFLRENGLPAYRGSTGRGVEYQRDDVRVPVQVSGLPTGFRPEHYTAEGLAYIMEHVAAERAKERMAQMAAIRGAATQARLDAHITRETLDDFLRQLDLEPYQPRTVVEVEATMRYMAPPGTGIDQDQIRARMLDALRNAAGEGAEIDAEETSVDVDDWDEDYE
jgi:hypothetical protein